MYSGIMLFCEAEIGSEIGEPSGTGTNLLGTHVPGQTSVRRDSYDQNITLYLKTKILTAFEDSKMILIEILIYNS